MTCPHCGKSPADPLRPGAIIALRRTEKGLSQLGLLVQATEYAVASDDEELAAKLSRRETQWLSRVETNMTGPPPFAELEALCAVLDLDPAKTAKGVRS